MVLCGETTATQPLLFHLPLLFYLRDKQYGNQRNEYFVCVCVRECARVCPAALPATVAINEEYQAAEQDTHQLDVCIPPPREQCCANETGREILKGWEALFFTIHMAR